ncbi:MAG: helix-turn-helix transcriptional regulator [Chitinophagales bacterium]|nr:helix-turn-helix transcriptional regulator [Chitinophagales bacterium]
MSQEIEIINKATELFFQYGVRSVTMDDLSKDLGISKKTLYQFVQNKSDLVKKALENFMKTQRVEIDFILNQKKQCYRRDSIYWQNKSKKFKKNTSFFNVRFRKILSRIVANSAGL